jgi:hypothetical protein
VLPQRFRGLYTCNLPSAKSLKSGAPDKIRTCDLCLRRAEHLWRQVAATCRRGLPPKTVQTFAGHSSSQFTMDRYGHRFRSDDHGRAMDAIASEIYSVAEPVRPSKMPGEPKPGPEPQNG